MPFSSCYRAYNVSVNHFHTWQIVMPLSIYVWISIEHLSFTFSMSWNISENSFNVKSFASISSSGITSSFSYTTFLIHVDLCLPEFLWPHVQCLLNGSSANNPGSAISFITLFNPIRILLLTLLLVIFLLHFQLYGSNSLFPISVFIKYMRETRKRYNYHFFCLCISWIRTVLFN